MKIIDSIATPPLDPTALRIREKYRIIKEACPLAMERE
jgi:hypothetical protein